MAKKTEATQVEEVVTEVKTAFKVSGVTKDAALTVLVESNPKRPSSASYARFEGYLTNPKPATVEAALQNGLTMGDIKFDIVHNFISVEGAEVVEYEVKPRGPRAEKEDSAGADVIAEGADENF